MRTLNPVSDKQKLQQSKVDKEIQNDIERIDAAITDLQTQQAADEQALQDYKDQNTRGITTANVVSTSATIDTVNSTDVNVSGTVTAGSTATATLDVTANANIANADIDALTADNITAAQAAITSETVGTSDITNASIENLTVGNLTVTEAYDFDTIDADTGEIDSLTTSTLVTDSLSANTADIATADIDNVIVDTATIDNLTSLASRITNLENTQLYHKFNVQTLQDPAAGAKNVVEIPYFMSGEYVVTLRDNSDNEIFSAYITNSGSNLTFAYSRAAYTTGDPASLLEAKIKTFNTKPQLYLSTERGGKLYWHYSGRDLLLDSSPNTWATWPFPIQSDTMNYICYHRAATVFSQHLDYGDNTSPAVGGATLYLTPTTDYNEHTNTGVEYNTQSDVPFNVYVPDQSLNTNDEVKFKKVAVDELAITSITENFMFLRSRTDGTFEVVLAVNNDTISGMENIDNPVTAKSIYNWNGIALGGAVTISDVCSVDNSLYLCSNEGDFYRRTQYVNKTPDAAHLDTKAIKKKVGADYLPFRIVSTGEYASREYVHYEVATGDYAGLYFDFFTDDTGELYQSNYQSFTGFDEDWCIPTTLYDAYLLECKYYATTERYPVSDNEGTNEYHITHLGDGTEVHGSLLVDDGVTASSLTVQNDATIGADAFIGKDLTVSGIADITGSTLIHNNLNVANKIAASSLAVTNGITAASVSAPVITTSELTANDIVTSSLITDTFKAKSIDDTGSTLVITNSTLDAHSTNGIFSSIDTALAKAAELRTSGNKVYIDNTDDNESTCAVEAAFDTSTLVDLNITKPTESTTTKTWADGDTFTFNGTTYTFDNNVSPPEIFQWYKSEDKVKLFVETGETLEITKAQMNSLFGGPVDWTDSTSVGSIESVGEDGASYFHSTFPQDITAGTPSQLKLSSQFIAKRKTGLSTNIPLAFDGDEIVEAVSVPFTNADTKLKKALIAERASLSTTDYALSWSDEVGGSGNGTTLVLTTAEYNTRAAITDMNDPLYIPANALVILTDADDEYLHCEEETI